MGQGNGPEQVGLHLDLSIVGKEQPLQDVFKMPDYYDDSQSTGIEKKERFFGDGEPKEQRMQKKRIPIGKFLVARGLISVTEEREIAAEQGVLDEDNYEAFGRIAVRKGFISADAVREAMKERARLEKEK